MQNALATAGIAGRRFVSRAVERHQIPADCAVLVAVCMNSSGDCPPQPRSSGPADGLTHPADGTGGFAHFAGNHVALDDARDPGRREEIGVAKCDRKGKRSRKQAHSPRHPRIPKISPQTPLYDGRVSPRLQAATKLRCAWSASVNHNARMGCLVRCGTGLSRMSQRGAA
jgi:hypothetical protein